MPPRPSSNINYRMWGRFAVGYVHRVGDEAGTCVGLELPKQPLQLMSCLVLTGTGEGPCVMLSPTEPICAAAQWRCGTPAAQRG